MEEGEEDWHQELEEEEKEEEAMRKYAVQLVESLAGKVNSIKILTFFRQVEKRNFAAKFSDLIHSHMQGFFPLQEES